MNSGYKRGFLTFWWKRYEKIMGASDTSVVCNDINHCSLALGNPLDTGAFSTWKRCLLTWQSCEISQVYEVNSTFRQCKITLGMHKYKLWHFPYHLYFFSCRRSESWANHVSPYFCTSFTYL